MNCLDLPKDLPNSGVAMTSDRDESREPQHDAEGAPFQHPPAEQGDEPTQQLPQEEAPPHQGHPLHEAPQPLGEEQPLGDHAARDAGSPDRSSRPGGGETQALPVFSAYEAGDRYAQAGHPQQYGHQSHPQPQQAHTQQTQPAQRYPHQPYGAAHHASGAPATYPGQPSQDTHPYYAPPQPPKQKRTIGVGGFIAGVLVAGLVGGSLVAGFSSLSGDGVAAPGIDINNPESATEVTAAAAKASPSVVTLAVTGQQGSGSGSGIVLDDQGHVLTNTHVVTLGGQTNDPEISVRMDDGSVTSAEVVGTDPLSDLAVVQLEDTSGLTPAELGNSGELNVGDQAIAIGAPLGLEGTVTDGIVSTLDRTISVASSDAEDEDTEEVPEEPEDGGEEDPEGFEFFFPDQDQAPTQGYIHINVIQTDAAINQGNSGGALVNSQGEIIGVNVAIASTGGFEADAGSIGVGFAIPIDYAQRVAEELIENGEVQHGLMGVQVLDSSADGLEPEDAMFREGFTNGALVDSIPEGSPAGDAGLQDGDLITHVNDRVVTDASSLTAVVREYAAGDTVTVTYVRDGEEQEAEVTLDGM